MAKNGNGMSIKIPLQFAFSLLPDVLLPSALHGGPLFSLPLASSHQRQPLMWEPVSTPQPFCQITGRGCMAAETMKQCGRGPQAVVLLLILGPSREVN